MKHPNVTLLDDNTAVVNIPLGRRDDEQVEMGGALRITRRDTDRDGHTEYVYEIWIGGKRVETGKTHTGARMDRGPQDALGHLCSYLSASAESYDYWMRTGHEGENFTLFTAPVREWSYHWDAEFGTLSFELAEMLA